MVLVNDFGELNIDADLLESAEEDTLTLSNGCICCTMGAELMYALGDALDRRPHVDCLVIEASGVAQPAKIARAAEAEPEMRYCGIVTVADAANIAERLTDRMIGAQIADQVRDADLILLTKTDLADDVAARAAMAPLARAPIIAAPLGRAPVDLLLERGEADPPPPSEDVDHGAVYRSWSFHGGNADETALRTLLADPPAGLYRFKGRISLRSGGAIEAHLVGRTTEFSRLDRAETRVAAIGVAPDFDPAEMERRWAAVRC